MTVGSYIRKVSLVITTKNNGTVEIYDLSELHIVFKVTANVQQTPNSANIKVYNLNNNTYKSIIDNSAGAEVVLSAGYDDNFGIIFKGQITQIFRNKESNIDTNLNIIAIDGDNIFSDGFVSLSEERGTSPNSRLYTIVNNSTEPTSIDKIEETKTNEEKSVRGKVYFGLVKEELRKSTSANGQLWYIKNNKVVVYSTSIYTEEAKKTTILNHKTGMIGFPTQTQEGINVKTLLNPNIVEGDAIEVNSNSIQLEEISTDRTNIDKYTQSSINSDGVYRILQVSHEGDNRGQEWYSNLITVNANVLYVENKAQQEVSTIPTVIPIKR